MKNEKTARVIDRGSSFHELNALVHGEQIQSIEILPAFRLLWTTKERPTRLRGHRVRAPCRAACDPGIAQRMRARKAVQKNRRFAIGGFFVWIYTMPALRTFYIFYIFIIYCKISKNML